MTKFMRSSLRRCRLLAVVVSVNTLLLGSCSKDDPVRDDLTAVSTTVVPSNTVPSSLKPAFPRSIEIGDRVVTIAEEPVRIAALSTDVAEVLLTLTGPERIVALPEVNTGSAIGSYPELAVTVPNQIHIGDQIDTELLEQWGTDLVVISPNHSQEAELVQNLQGSTIAVLTMPNTWDTLEDAQHNILLIGEATDTETTARQIITDMQQRIEQVDRRIADLDDKPTVLILTNVAGVPFLIGPGVSTTDLVHKAGGVNVAHALGVETPINPVTTSQIITANPDRILLIDGLGTGRSAFEALLSDSAVAEVPAIVHDHVLVLPARITFGVAHTLVDGLEAIADWLHPA